ncbi:hypothetical protein tb265_32180 [Gemmatimonadetes bacterium T265]|nr:hypothetical protein tb265_32180 [Gemmatimonadetes bacterium T265]
MDEVIQFAGVMAVITTSVLAMAGGIVWVIRTGRRGAPPAGEEIAALRARVAQLEQAVDVVAVEVERVGEAQRYTERLFAPAPGAATAPPARPY